MAKFSQNITGNALMSTMFLTSEIEIDQYVFIDVLILHVKLKF